MRVSTLRVSHGENMVLRILASTEELYNLKNLGIDENDIDKLRTSSRSPSA